MLNHSNKSTPVDSEDLVSIIKQTFDSGGIFRLLVTGGSMFPFIKHMRDSVILTHPSKRKLKRGEIVFIEREPNILVLHRVFKMKPDGFIMNGDAQLWDEFVPFSQVFAVVSKIERKGRLISCDNKLYRFISELWMLLRPFRGFIFKCAGLILTVYRKTTSLLRH